MNKSVQVTTTDAERSVIRELVDRLENGVVGQDDRDAAAALIRRLLGQKSDGTNVGRGRIPKDALRLNQDEAPLVSGMGVEIARVVHGLPYQNAIQDAADSQGISERAMAQRYAEFQRSMESLGIGWKARTPQEKLEALQTFMDAVAKPDEMDCQLLVGWASSCGVQMALDRHGIGREQRLDVIGFSDFVPFEQSVIRSVTAWALNSAYPKGASRKTLREDAEKVAFGEAYGVLAQIATKKS